MVVHVAPGSLSNKTKIVRFLPRFVVVNNLRTPIRIWQDSSVLQPTSSGDNSKDVASSSWPSVRKLPKDAVRVTQYEYLWGRNGVDLNEGNWSTLKDETTASGSALLIASLAPGDVAPFSLPDSRRDRLLRVDLGRPWDLSASVPADTPGNHTLHISPTVDLQSLPHVSTRSSPQYEVRVSHCNSDLIDGNLGIWFEREVDTGSQIVVKAIEKDSFAFKYTDVHVGDELLAIDGVTVVRMSFDEAMALLKCRMGEVLSRTHAEKTQPIATSAMNDVSSISRRNLMEPEGDDTGLIITFRSVEERLRLVRRKAALSSEYTRKERPTSSHDISSSGHSDYGNISSSVNIRVELKTFERSDVGMFVVVSGKPRMPFRLRNQSICTTVCYRQKGCSHHPWHYLNPGQSSRYTWEEPLRPKRLLVRATKHGPGRKERSQISLRHEEEEVFTAPVSVRLEEIGFEDTISLPNQSSTQGLRLVVDVEESSRTLVITDVASEDKQSDALRERLGSLSSLISQENTRLDALRGIDAMWGDSEKLQENRIADIVRANSLPEPGKSIVGCHQVLISVQEARGLNCGSLVGVCNPYVEVRLKGSRDLRKRFSRKRDIRRSVYVRDTPNPTWKDQTFLFDVPENAALVTRGHSVEVKVRSFRTIGRHMSLGRTTIDLHCLRDQKPKEGWFPLSGRSEHQELLNGGVHWGRASIRLRIQWIYALPALLQYFVLLSEQKLHDLGLIRSGIEHQLGAIEVTERNREEETNDFKPLRFQELFSLSKNNMKARAAARERKRNSAQNVVKKLIDPLLNSDKGRVKGMKKMSDERDSIPLLRNGSPMCTSNSPEAILRKRLGSSPGVVRGIENQISETRQAIQRIQPSRSRFGSSQTVESDFIKLPAQSFKSWVLLQALHACPDLELLVVDNEIRIQLRNCGHSSLNATSTPKPWSLHLPNNSSSILAAEVVKRRQEFLQARETVGRYARTTVETILHCGGWLTIRPITALNIADGFSRLYVETKYGTEVLTSGGSDGAVKPEWSSTSYGYESKNDMHIHVAPQKFSGSIRVAVIGEKKSKRLRSRVELGVLFLPLGAAIASCVNQEHQQREYVRWFPLKKRKDTVHSEGDSGLHIRPTETEKLDPQTMDDQFAPCLQLSLSWMPETRGNSLSQQPIMAPSKKPLVQQYFILEFGSISMALIDSVQAKEVMAFNILDVDLHYWATRAKSRIGVTSGWFQIDYQDHDTLEPVVVAPAHGDRLVPVIQTLAVKDNAKSTKGVAALDFVDISVAEFDVTIEENLLSDLFAFVTAMFGEASKLTSKPRLFPVSKSGESEFYSLLQAFDNSAQESGLKLYIRQLYLGVLKINLSYVKGRRFFSNSTEDLYGNRGLYEFPVHEPASQLLFADNSQSRLLPSYLTNLLPNVSDAPIRLPGKALSHVFQSPGEILKWVRRFYVTEILKQLYRILGES